MSNPLSSGQTLAETALVTATAASCVVPAGVLLCSQLYEMQADPGTQFDAGMAWIDLAQSLQQAIAQAERINNSVGASWSDDPAETAFTEKAADYIRQLMTDMVFAYAVGIGLIVSAVATFVAIVVGLVLAVILGIFAAEIIALAASVVGDFGPVEAMEAAANDFALDAYNSVKGLMEVVEGVDVAAAGEIGVFLAGDVGVQFALGDHDVLADLGQATVDGIGTITKGLLAKLYQTAVSKGIKAPGLNNPLRALSQAIGLDDTFSGSSLLDKAEDLLL